MGLGQLLCGVSESEEGPSSDCHGLRQVQRLVCHWQLHLCRPLSSPQNGGMCLCHIADHTVFLKDLYIWHCVSLCISEVSSSAYMLIWCSFLSEVSSFRRLKMHARVVYTWGWKVSLENCHRRKVLLYLLEHSCRDARKLYSINSV